MTLQLSPPGQTRPHLLQTEVLGAPDDYYAWRTHQVALRGVIWSVYAKPGMPRFDGLDPAAALLAEYLDVAAGESVLVFNGGNGLVGAVAAALAGAGRVALADANVVAVEAARRTLAANGLENVIVTASHGVSHMTDPAPVDVVAVRLPKGKQAALQLIWDAFHALKSGGRLFLAGANNEGIKTYLRHMEELFGNGRLVAYRKGCRVGMAVKPEQISPLPKVFSAPWLDHEHFESFRVEMQGNEYVVCSRPGVFAWDRLDRGTQALLEAMDVRADDHVLDLGCGYGIVGVVAADRARTGAAHLVDAHVTAVEAARRTVAANGLSNGHVHLSDCAAAVRNQQFDLVLANPPFHHGKATQYDVAQQFMRDAAAVLKSRGRFYLVANQFLAYEEPLREPFGQVETVYWDNQFKVLLATRPKK